MNGRGVTAPGLATLVLLAGVACATTPGPLTRVDVRTPAPACAGRVAADTSVRPRAALTSPATVRTAVFLRYDWERAPVDDTLTVALRYVVMGNGSVDPVSVEVVSADDSTFIPVARKTVMQMTFWPACVGDSAVSSEATQRFNYLHIEGRMP